MAAGLGFKTFAVGEVLTAADTNGYLMQGVLVFASAAARDAAITSPQEGQFAYLKDTNVTTYYTGSAWANLDTTGMVNPMTTTGDTIYSSSGSTPARLGIGSNGNVLTVAGGVPTWAAPAGGGQSFTLLNAGGTALTGSTTVTVSGISGYNQYLVYLTGASTANSSAIVCVRINGDTSANYHCPAIYFEPAATIGDAADESATKIRLGRTGQSEATSVFGNVLISAGNSTGKKPFSAQGMGNGNSVYRGYTTIGFYQGTSVISSISAFSESGNFDDGLILIYGA
jgi:hypothetical protein